MTLKSDNIYLSSHPENMQAENRVIPVENEMVNGIEHEGQGGTEASQHQERVSFASHGEYREYVLLGQNDIPCSAAGIPLCPGGKAMLYHMTDRQGRHMYHCPIKRNTHRNHKEVIATHLDECPLHALCEPDSKLGPSIYVAPHANPRLHPHIPRESKEYKELRNMRGCCERSNSIKKEYYRADDLNTRVMSYAFIRLTLISILEHSRVRAMQLLAPLRQEHRLDTANDLLRVFS